jgi:hypothetical protein
VHLVWSAVLLIGFSALVGGTEGNQSKVDAAKRHLETTMTTCAVTFILKVSNGQVETDSVGTLRTNDSGILKDLSFYSSRKQPVTVAFDRESGRIASVSSAPTDLVVGISSTTTSDQRVGVQLMLRPSLLYLYKSNPRFDQLYSIVNTAAAEKRRVHFGVLAGNDVIEDVRLEIRQ